MKRYQNLSALLSGELGTRAPSTAAINRMAAQILAEYPQASHLVFFRNGHWCLLPAGPECPLKSPRDAENKTIPPHRRALAYCKI